MSIVKVGKAAPEFILPSISAGDDIPRLATLADYSGRWLMLIFYPRDFTFVCPTELTAFSARLPDFSQRGCELLGISVDSIELHQEWLSTSPADGGLGPLQFPLASDTDGSAARAYGVWVEEKEVSTRGLFIIDPDGVLQYAVLHNLSVGRSPDEVLRVLDALRTGGLCPASWTSADGTIDPERALKPGTILGHYRIRQQLGAGTFGTVFEAWDMRLERQVALKVLKHKLFESRQAALAESRAAARLNDPHVCTLYAVEEEDGLPMIVMEYLDGRPLSRMLAEGLARDTGLDLAAQIAAGVATAHVREVVHGDLKPANVMVTNSGIAKILDFGLARTERTSDSENASAGQRPLTGAAPDLSQIVDEVDATVDIASSQSEQRGGIQGSLAYMSPEQSFGLPATPASDVFSFGLILVEVLTGSRALAEKSPVLLVARLQAAEFGPELANQIDEAYRELVAELLAYDPAQRPPMAQVVRRLASTDVS